MDPYRSSFIMLDNVLVFSFSLASFPANQSLLRIHRIMWSSTNGPANAIVLLKNWVNEVPYQFGGECLYCIFLRGYMMPCSQFLMHVAELHMGDYGQTAIIFKDCFNRG